MAVGDLCTLDQVREFLQKPDDHPEQDALIESVITRASAAIRSETGREFAPVQNVTRTFAYSGRGYVQTGDIRAATAVTWNSQDKQPVALDATDGWKLRPVGGTPGEPYSGLYLPKYATDNFSSWWDVAVDVTGDFGFAKVPVDVEHACIVTVTVWMREVAAITPDGGVERFERRGAVPADVLAGLAHYADNRYVA